MKLKNIIYSIFIASFLYSTTLHAQVSGYLGKRLIIKLDTYTNLYFNSNNPKSYPVNHFPIRKNIGFEFIVGRKSVLGLSFGNNKTQFHFDDYFQGISKTGELNNNRLSISYTIYRKKNAIAPVGKYVQFYFSYFHSNYSARIITDYQNPDNFTEVNKTGTLKNFMLGLVFGNSGVLFDRMLYSYGLQFGYRFGTLDKSKNDTNRPIRTVEHHINNRNSYNEMWGFHAGIGILL